MNVSYAYHGLNRITSKVYSGGAATPSASYAKGRLTAAYNSNSSTLYTSFDPLGRITGGSQVTANNTYSFSYGYNSAGDLICEQYPSGRLVLTSYDLANRVGQVSGGTGTCASSTAASPAYAGGPSSTQTIQYAPHGAPWLYVMGNNVWHALNYNSRLQVCGSQDVLAASSWSAPSAAAATCANASVTGGTPLLSASLSWYPNTNAALNNGTLQASSYAHSGPGLTSPLTFTQTYTYDNVNRLSSIVDTNSNCTIPGAVPVCYSRSFGYDNFGNMYISGAAGIAPAGNAPQGPGLYNGNNQLTSGYYDAAGNQTLVNGDSIAYDAENRQISVSGIGVNESYLYDSDGRRVEKSVGGTPQTVFVYDAMGRMAAEYSVSVATPACVTCYLSADHLGTPRIVTDQNMDVVARHDYLPFGEEIAANVAGRTSQWGTANDSINQKFTGKERDAESGLDYFGARYYGSALGRFTSPDPENTSGLNHLEDSQSWNAYSYVRNNPLKYTDPDGQDWTVCESNGSNCGTVTDDKAFDKFNSQTGNYVEGGKYYDSSGNQIGTASWSAPVDPTAGNAVAFLNFTIGAMASNYVFGAGEAAIGIGAEALMAARIGQGVATATKAGRVIKVIEEAGGAIHLEIQSGGQTYEVIASVSREGGKIVLNGAHIEGSGAGQFGTGMLREIREAVRQFGEEQGASEVVVNPGVRTSGANPGRAMRSFSVRVE